MSSDLPPESNPDVGSGPDSPVDAVPVDSEPVDSEPVDAVPVDSEPVDAVPVDSEPVDAVPVDGDGSLLNPYSVSPLSGLAESLLVQPDSPDQERPRWWTPLAIAVIALVLCMVASTVMIYVAMVVVVGQVDPMQLYRPTTLESIMESRLGFCLVLVPPQLMLLISSVVAAQLSPVNTLQRLSLVRGHWPLWAWLGAAAAAPLIGLISTVVLGQFMSESESLEFMSNVFRRHCDSGFLIPLAFLIGITPAICEEILFRGYVQTRLVRSFGPAIGVTIASVMFAAFHMDVVHSVAVLPLGFFLGFVAARSGSIFPAVLAHFVNNAVSVVGVAMAPTNETDVFSVPTLMITLSILTAGMIGVALVVLASIRYRPSARDLSFSKQTTGSSGASFSG